MKTHGKQRGQALIIIALAAVGLFAFASLAIDGGMVLSRKRAAQNAADAAALSGALQLVRGDDATVLSAAYASAKQNTFNNDTTTNEVHVYHPPIDGPYAGQDQYVQVRILAHVTTYLTRVIGRKSVDTAVEAIAHATLPELVAWHNGDALVSLMPGCRQIGESDDPFVVSGNARVKVNKAGIRVNSDCEKNGQQAFSQGGNSNIASEKGTCVAAGAAGINYTPGHVSPAPQTCPPSDNTQYQLPNPTCTHTGKIEEVAPGEYLAWPGNYNSVFPGVSPSGTLKLLKGIYCLHDGLDLHSTWKVTTDLGGAVGHDSLTEGAFFFVDQGDITFNGTSDINIHAIDSTVDDFPEEFLNFLFYVPPTNEANIKLTGDSGSQFTGTILAPASHTEILGNNSTLALNSQVISYTVKVSGGGDVNITYNEDENNRQWTNPGVKLVK